MPTGVPSTTPGHKGERLGEACSCSSAGAQGPHLIDGTRKAEVAPGLPELRPTSLGAPHTLLPARGASPPLCAQGPRVMKYPPASSQHLVGPPSRPRFPAGRLGHWGLLGHPPAGRSLWFQVAHSSASCDCHWPRGSVQGWVPDTDPLRTPAHGRRDGKGEATTSEISSPTGHALLSQTGPDSSPLWA